MTFGSSRDNRTATILRVVYHPDEVRKAAGAGTTSGAEVASYDRSDGIIGHT
jgi:hypothetical protein